MLKLIKPILLSFIGISFCISALGGTGCLLFGNTVYPNINNPSVNPSTSNAWYKNTGAFARRTYTGDPQCGVLYSQLNFVSPYKACDVVGVGNYGGVVTWLDSNNTCNVPLDNHITLLFIFCGFLSYRVFKNRFDLAL
ncbi:hypothetical protein INP83_10650 [Mucilaginibacter sp. 21P]|uniref:hypothetical protein n=1 Tax=Mucilaginibacter sp. 21P TaxID=2778902 RepID=UPI001C57337F|nr:hypothetical protein [Mucilaginibacter sp. 21P]QXV67515.1 hypothetical protein INP83_10650 [Mucilaginibacter sp. 21P]